MGACNEPGEGQPSIVGWVGGAEDREQGSKHLLSIRWLEPRLLTFLGAQLLIGYLFFIAG